MVLAQRPRWVVDGVAVVAAKTGGNRGNRGAWLPAAAAAAVSAVDCRTFFPSGDRALPPLPPPLGPLRAEITGHLWYILWFQLEYSSLAPSASPEGSYLTAAYIGQREKCNEVSSHDEARLLYKYFNRIISILFIG